MFIGSPAICLMKIFELGAKNIAFDVPSLYFFIILKGRKKKITNLLGLFICYFSFLTAI